MIQVELDAVNAISVALSIDLTPEQEQAPMMLPESLVPRASGNATGDAGNADNKLRRELVLRFSENCGHHDNPFVVAYCNLLERYFRLIQLTAYEQIIPFCLHHFQYLIAHGFRRYMRINCLFYFTVFGIDFMPERQWRVPKWPPSRAELEQLLARWSGGWTPFADRERANPGNAAVQSNVAQSTAGMLPCTGMGISQELIDRSAAESFVSGPVFNDPPAHPPAEGPAEGPAAAAMNPDDGDGSNATGAAPEPNAEGNAEMEVEAEANAEGIGSAGSAAGAAAPTTTDASADALMPQAGSGDAVHGSAPMETTLPLFLQTHDQQMKALYQSLKDQWMEQSRQDGKRMPRLSGLSWSGALKLEPAIALGSLWAETTKPEFRVLRGTLMCLILGHLTGIFDTVRNFSKGPERKAIMVTCHRLARRDSLNSIPRRQTDPIAEAFAKACRDRVEQMTELAREACGPEEATVVNAYFSQYLKQHGTLPPDWDIDDLEDADFDVGGAALGDAPAGASSSGAAGSGDGMVGATGADVHPPEPTPDRVVDAAPAPVAGGATGAAASAALGRPGDHERSDAPQDNSGGAADEEHNPFMSLLNNAFGSRPRMDLEGINTLSNKLTEEAGKYIVRLCRKREMERNIKQGATPVGGAPDRATTRRRTSAHRGATGNGA